MTEVISELPMNPPFGVIEAIEAAGIPIRWIGGEGWCSAAPAAARQIIATHNPLAAARAHRLAEIAAYRWQRENAGMTVNGIAVRTDDRSKMMLSAARLRAEPVRWKTPNGFVNLTIAEINAMFEAVSNYVQACFDREAELTEQILRMNDCDAVLALDITMGWPEQ